MNTKLLLTFFLLSLSTMVCAQRVAVSTDVLKWGTVSPNISVDLVLDSRLSLNMEMVFDPLIDINFKRTNLSTELRYWFRSPLYSHYLGVNVVASKYDLKYNNHIKNEQMVSIGIGYGYSIIVNRRVSITPHIGVGYGFVRSHTNPELNGVSSSQKRFEPVLSKIGISFSYIIN